MPPEVAFAVALLSLLGSLATALVYASNARKLNDATKILQTDQQKHDAAMANAEAQRLADLASQQRARDDAKAAADEQRQKDLEAQKAAREEALAEAARLHDKGLQELTHAHQERMAAFAQRSAMEFETFKREMQNELSIERMQAIVNEANWRRVHEQVINLSKVGFDMIDRFKSACDGATMTDDVLFGVAAEALKLHGQFKPLLKEARSSGFRDDDYSAMSKFHEGLVKVFLDVAGSQAERQLKAEVMTGHKASIERSEAHFRRIVDVFLKPQGQVWSRKPGATRTSASETTSGKRGDQPPIDSAG